MRPLSALPVLPTHALMGFCGAGVFAIAGLLALAFLGPAPARAQSSKPQQALAAGDLRKVEAARDAALKRLRALEQAGAAAEREAAAIDADMLDAAADAQAREEAAAATEARLYRLEDEAAVARARLAADAGTSEDLFAAVIAMGSRRPPALATSPDDAGRAIRAALLMSDAAPALAARADGLRQHLAALDAATEGVLREREVLASEETALAARRQEIEALAAEKRHARASLASETDALRAESDDLATKADDLRDLVDRLAKAAAARPKAKAPPPKPAAKAPAKSTASATKPAPAASGPLARAETAGKALTPAVGRILRRFGQSSDGSRSQGLTFSTRAGTQVVAPRDARIQYAGLFRTYGNMLILDVGEDYLVVVSGLDALYPEAGQKVLAGEPIGRMAARSQPAPELYLEVRKAGQPVDPEGWLAKGR
jgi:septal ring factor EnvC (AmiA/AmiB activator)